MGKVENHKRDLYLLLDEGADLGDPVAIRNYLVENSALPGRRANLELARAFAELIDERPGAHDAAWALCLELASLAPEDAPVNSPEEFLPFCGVIGLGVLGAAAADRLREALDLMRQLASDPRWRMREAVAQGLQRLINAHGKECRATLADWVAGGNLLEMRAAAAAVAEPDTLVDRAAALAALELHREILEHVGQAADRRSEEFRILRKGLGYTLSVVVQAVPRKGFALIEELADLGDRDLLWIVKQNLGKNRLVKNFPQRVRTIRERL